MHTICKVFAFLLRPGHDATQELLVFYDQSENLNVPKGTVEQGEHPERAVLRELYEESGIDTATVIQCIGQRRTMVPGGPDRNGPLEEQLHIGYVLKAHSELPNQWNHIVKSDGVEKGNLFRFRWIPLTVKSGKDLAFGADWFVTFICQILSERDKH